MRNADKSTKIAYSATPMEVENWSGIYVLDRITTKS